MLLTFCLSQLERNKKNPLTLLLKKVESINRSNKKHPSFPSRQTFDFASQHNSMTSHANHLQQQQPTMTPLGTALLTSMDKFFVEEPFPTNSLEMLLWSAVAFL